MNFWMQKYREILKNHYTDEYTSFDLQELREFLRIPFSLYAIPFPRIGNSAPEKE